MTQDELFVTAAAASRGVTVTNRSDKERSGNVEAFRSGQSGRERTQEMKYGVNTFIWTASFTRDNLLCSPRSRRHGFDGVRGFPCSLPADFALQDIRQGLEQNHLECTICSVIPRGLSVISDDAVRAPEDARPPGRLH